ncbi:hypothetical protein G6F68_010746 [Rhizopus microsporus]|nr:hypothetical protein G6F68_010746 [Rhizopus microsporus]
MRAMGGADAAGLPILDEGAAVPGAAPRPVQPGGGRRPIPAGCARARRPARSVAVAVRSAPSGRCRCTGRADGPAAAAAGWRAAAARAGSAQCSGARAGAGCRCPPS